MTYGASPPFDNRWLHCSYRQFSPSLSNCFRSFYFLLKLALISTAQIEYCPLCLQWSWIDGEKGSDWITREISQEDKPFAPTFSPRLLSQVTLDRLLLDVFFLLTSPPSLTEGDISLQSIWLFAVWITLMCISSFFFSFPFHPKNNVEQAPNIPPGGESSKQTWLACQIELDSVCMLVRIESTRGNCGRQTAEANAEMIVFINKGSVTRKTRFLKSWTHAVSILRFISYLLTSSCLQ